MEWVVSGCGKNWSLTLLADYQLRRNAVAVSTAWPSQDFSVPGVQGIEK
jgi:hypothetical protein